MKKNEAEKVINNQKLAFKKKANKIKKNIFLSIIKEFKNFFKKLYWKTFFNLGYFFRTFIYLGLKKSAIIKKWKDF